VLDRVVIKNYRCLVDVGVDLAPFTVLIGPNDSGKSTFLKSLELLGRLLNPTKQERDSELVNVTKELLENSTRLDKSLDVSIALESHSPVPFQYSVIASRNSATEQFIRIRGDELRLPQKDQNRGSKPNKYPYRFASLDPSSLKNQSVFAHLCRLSEKVDADLLAIREAVKISAPYRFSPDEMRKPSAPSDEPLSAAGSNLAAALHAMLTSADRDAVISLEKSLNAAVPTLSNVSTPLNKTNSNQLNISFALKGNERPPITIGCKDVSDGALILTAFLVLIYSHSDRVLLIEEPENSLHPSRLKSVIELLRKLTTGELGFAPCQVIITTHSPILLNCVEPSEVRVFQRREDGSTKVNRMDAMPEIETLSKEFSSGELWYLFGEDKLAPGN